MSETLMGHMAADDLLRTLVDACSIELEPLRHPQCLAQLLHAPAPLHLRRLPDMRAERRRSTFEVTHTDLRLIAALAIIGERSSARGRLTMDWTVYWFMLPACVVIAATATFSGISGAALMTPMFLIAFPLLGVPRLGTVEAIGAALFLETSGFGAAVYHYSRMRLADLKTAKALGAVTVPAAIGGALIAHHAPATALRIAYGIAMIGVAWLIGRSNKEQGRPAARACPCLVCESECSAVEGPPHEQRRLQAADGKTYVWTPHHLVAQRIFSGIGALLAGLISTGVGEATLPTLVRRSRFPVPVAAATSTFVVAATVLGASIAHGILLARHGGAEAIPWNLIVWGVPGAVAGATVGTRLQGRVSERATRIFFSALFLLIGITFLVAFTVFAHRFE